MDTKSNKKPSTARVNNRAKEIEELKAKIAELENGNLTDEIKIQQDEYISVMSLLPYNLNLSTREGGQGTTKKFTKFGEVKRILYKDLVDIMEVQPTFMNAGYFYILNPTLIRHHGLDDVYSRILTKEKIEEILSTNSEGCLTLYNSANEQQQEIIIQLLIEKVRNNPNSVNLNIIDKISRISKVDIIKKAEEERIVEAIAKEKAE